MKKATFLKKGKKPTPQLKKKKLKMSRYQEEIVYPQVGPFEKLSDWNLKYMHIVRILDIQLSECQFTILNSIVKHPHCPFKNVTLGNIGFNKERMILFANGLGCNFHRISSIDVQRNENIAGGMLMLGKALMKCTWMKSVGLRKCDLRKDGFYNLVRYALNNTGLLESIDVSCNAIDDITRFIQRLENGKRGVSVKLCGNPIQWNQVRQLEEVCYKWTHLGYMDINRIMCSMEEQCRIRNLFKFYHRRNVKLHHQQDLRKMMKCVQRSDCSIIHLRVENVEMDIAHAKLLAKGIETNRMLQSIVLNNNRIISDAIVLIAQAIHRQGQINYICLENNNIAKPSMYELAKVLRVSNKVTQLHVKNAIGMVRNFSTEDKCTLDFDHPLTSYICTNFYSRTHGNCLTHISLVGVGLHDVQGGALLGALSWRSVLCSLDLEGNYLTDYLQHAIANCMTKSFYLNTINVAKNALTIQTLVTMLASAVHSTKLKTIVFGAFDGSNNAFDKVYEHAFNCKSLWKLYIRPSSGKFKRMNAIEEINQKLLNNGPSMQNIVITTNTSIQLETASKFLYPKLDDWVSMIAHSMLMQKHDINHAYIETAMQRMRRERSHRKAAKSNAMRNR